MRTALAWIPTFAKALLAGAIGAVGVIAAGYTDDSLTRAEVWTAAGTALTAVAGVYGTRNAPDPVRPEDDPAEDV